MTLAAWLTVGVLIVMLVELVREKYPPDLVMMGTLVVFILLGIITPNEALQGFSNQALATVAAMVIIAQGLYATGALEPLAARMFKGVTTASGALFRLMLVTMFLSAFMNNTPLVAMFIPVVTSFCRRTRIAPSKLLLPLSFASMLGGVCTLIGTSTNLVVAGLMNDKGLEPMGMWTLTPIGLPVAIVGGLFIAVIGARLLPSHSDLLHHVAEEDRREYLVEMRLQGPSPLIGQTIEHAGLRSLPGLFLVRIERGTQTLSPVTPEDVLHEGDRLVFAGVVETIVDLQKFRGLVPDAMQRHPDADTRWRLVEAVISPSSPLIGSTVREAHFRARYNAAVVAIHRHGERLHQKIGDVDLRPGDTLLLEASPAFARTFRNSRDFFLVSELEETPATRYGLAYVALTILLLVIGVATFEVVPMVIASLAGAVAVAVAGCITPSEAKRAVDPAMLVVIAASFGIAAALEKTGVGKMLADAIVMVGSNFGPVGVLAGIFIGTVILTELLSNNAAAAIMFPIAMSSAESIGASQNTFALAVAVAASCSFILPMGYQTNMMVYGPGRYRFIDFLKVGVPTQLVVSTTAITALSFFM